MSNKNLSVLACGLVLALVSGCDTSSESSVRTVQLKRGVPANVSCPKGAIPTWRIKDSRRVVFECPDGDPIVTEVAAK